MHEKIKNTRTKKHAPVACCHVHGHVQVCAHAHVHARVHTRACACASTCARAHGMRVCAHACTRVFVFTCVHAACTHACVHECVRACVHAHSACCVHVCVHVMHACVRDHHGPPDTCVGTAASPAVCGTLQQHKGRGVHAAWGQARFPQHSRPPGNGATCSCASTSLVVRSDEQAG